MEGGCLGLDVHPWLFLFSSAHGPLCWSFLVISIKQNDFHGDRRVVGQSNAACSSGDWPDDVVQKLASINQHHVWSTRSRDRDTERLDEHGLVPCHPSSNSRTHRSGPEGLDSFQTGRRRLCQCSAAAIVDGLPLDSDCLLEQLHCFDLLLVMWNSLLSKVENCLLCSLPMANAF